MLVLECISSVETDISPVGKLLWVVLLMQAS